MDSLAEKVKEKIADKLGDRYWIFNRHRKGVRKKYEFGAHPELCKKIGHVGLRQTNEIDRSTHFFCVNCGFEITLQTMRNMNPMQMSRSGAAMAN